jgi:type I protein arginine methyltransferase
MGTIGQLFDTGILQDEKRSEVTLNPKSTGFDALPIHIKMLNDRNRTSSYLAAIREVVREGDIVVDLGTGTGILAMAAAQAGAKHVYAIEATGIGLVADMLFEANNLADRITLLPGWSTQVQLPERADVLISEIIGNEPLSENVLQLTGDAIQRFLKPDARFIPHKVKIYGLPVNVPHPNLMEKTCTSETIENWRTWYGMDFSALINVTQKNQQMFWVNPYAAREWETLSDPVLLVDIDLQKLQSAVVDKAVSAMTTSPGQVNGILIYFELDMGTTVRLSTCPQQVNINNHWSSSVWVIQHPLSFGYSELFTIRYKYDRTKNVHCASLVRS